MSSLPLSAGVLAMSSSLSDGFTSLSLFFYASFRPSIPFFLPTLLGGSDGKESAGSAGDPGLIPGLGRSPGEQNILAWRIPWTEEPGELQSMGLKRVGHD